MRLPEMLLEQTNHCAIAKVECQHSHRLVYMFRPTNAYSVRSASILSQASSWLIMLEEFIRMPEYLQILIRNHPGLNLEYSKIIMSLCIGNLLSWRPVFNDPEIVTSRFCHPVLDASRRVFWEFVVGHHPNQPSLPSATNPPSCIDCCCVSEYLMSVLF